MPSFVQDFLTFDIETRADEAAVEAAIAAKKDEFDAITAPSNYKDGAKIEKYIADKRQAAADAIRKEAALSPFTAYVSAIAMKYGQGRTKVMILVPYPGTDEALSEQYGCLDTPADVVAFPYRDACERLAEEKRMIGLFWLAFNQAGGRTVTFNGINFDFSFLLKRSLMLKPFVRPAMPPQLRRYQTEPTRDLYAILTGWGGHVPGYGLKALCRTLGIENPLPELNGGAVATVPWWVEAAYCANDVALTAELARRMEGWYWPTDWREHDEVETPPLPDELFQPVCLEDATEEDIPL